MSVIVFAEPIEGQYKKSTFEALTYGFDLAAMMGTSLTVVTVSGANAEALQYYGASETIVLTDEALKTLDAMTYAKALAPIVKEKNATCFVASATFLGRALTGRLAAALGAGLVSQAIGLPAKNADGSLVYKRSIYSGKGYGHFHILSPIQVLSIGINSYQVTERKADGFAVTERTALASDVKAPIQVTDRKVEGGTISLPEAELVVSAGRGLKGPEHWNLIEELANLIGAATACSKPVSDVGWRPHSEHVGQTGLTISPNLYIAIGISGAIQHLAGVNRSKVIVVINKDPEAPFFKAADYGIVGDAFEVIPKLIAATKAIQLN